MSRTAQSCRRRATAYVAVLGVSMIVSVIGVSALMAVRLQRERHESTNDAMQARLNARSAIDLVLGDMATDPNWRTRYGAVGGPSVLPTGDGTFELFLVDPADGDIAVGQCDPLIATAYGYAGNARQVLQVRLEADAASLDPIGERIMGLGPLTYWRLSETGGSVAADLMGQHDGQCQNGVAFDREVPYQCDTAAWFDGSDDFIEVPHHDDFMLADGTFQLWFYPESASNIQGLIGKDSLGFDEGGHMHIWYYYGTIMARLQSDDTSYSVQSSGVSPFQWHHVAFTFGSTGMTLYVDGNPVSSESYFGGLGTTSGGNGNREPIGIGVDTSDTGDETLAGWNDCFRGMIDEVAIFSRALDPGEVASIYEAGNTSAPTSMTPVAGTWKRVVD